MRLLDKLLSQAENTNQIYLFKEGIFWKVYNQGVYSLKGFGYKIALHHNKKSGKNYVSIGFPEIVVQKLKSNFEMVSQEETKIIFEINTSASAFNDTIYEEWFDGLLKNLLPNPCKTSINENGLRNQLKSYPLATKSPIEAFLWLSEIQSKL